MGSGVVSGKSVAGVDIDRSIIKKIKPKEEMRPLNTTAKNRWLGSRKSQKNLVIYLYVLVIFLSTFSFYTILQIESEKESKSKYKIIKTQTKSDENLRIPNLPQGNKTKFFQHELAKST